MFFYKSGVIVILTAVFGLHYSHAFSNLPFKQQSNLLRISQIYAGSSNKDPLKVLLVVEPTPFNYVSGYSNRFKEMLKGLKRIGDTVHVLTPDAKPDRPKDYLGFPITSVDGFRCPLYNDVRLSFDLRFKILEIIKSFKPDIIHLSTPSVLALGAILWSRWFKIPLVMSYHTDMISYVDNYIPKFLGARAFTTWYVKFILQFADLILCTSPQLKDRMLSMGVKRLGVWEKGINTEIYSPKFKSATMRNRLSEGHPKSPLLLYVGRLGYEKKLDRLKRVLDANPTARLALVGNGPAEKYLHEYFKDYPVHFTGQLHGEELSQAFASVDTFVMPSDTETLGFVVLESMASGVPVVGVSAGGLVDIIQHGKTGYLASNEDDMADFTACVSDILKDSSKRKKMGAEALEYTKKLSWDAATTKLSQVQYRQAIELFKAKQIHGEHRLSEEHRILGK